MKALSEMQAAAETNTTGSRVIAAEALGEVSPFDLSELQGGPAPRRRLTTRDLSNEVARAAYVMGRERGYAQGAQAGLKQGYSEGSRALDDYQSRTAADLGRQVQQLVEGFRAEMSALESQVASDLVSLAIDIARQVLRREPATDAQALLPAAREALRALGENASHLELQAHPADAALLRQGFEAQGVKARITEAGGLPRGSCRIEADTGVADAGFEARWQAVMASLGRDEEPLP